MLHLIRSAVREHEELDWSGEALSAQRQAERWSRRRRICARLAIVASVPLAYLAIAGLGFQSVLVRVIVGLWALTILSIFACATVIAHAEGRFAGLPPRTGRARLYPID